MMHSPFAHHEVLARRTWLQRLTRRGNPDMARPMITNLLSEKEPRDIDPKVFGGIVEQTGLSGSQLRAVAFEIYRQALAAFVADDQLTNEEVRYLDDLRKLLTLSNQELLKAECEVVHPRYQQALDEVLSDGKLSPEEAKKLSSLQLALRIDSTTVENLRSPRTAALFNRKLESVLSDRRVSPLEQQQLDEMAQNLGVPVTLSSARKADRDLFALYWQIENGPLPWYDVPIVLQKGERCHFAAQAVWHEFRTRTVRVNYGGPTYRLRIAKGLYYRIGSMNVAPVRKEELTQIDSGTVYFTNKRVIFDGTRANKTIRLSALLGVQPYTDGIGLEKATGKSPVLALSGNVELATVVLSAVLAQAN
jgi:hypothetical protein